MSRFFIADFFTSYLCVIPAQAGVLSMFKITLDSRLRGNDTERKVRKK
jgi:hypothetical protein